MEKPEACPSCGSSIIWLDGEPTPSLHVQQAEGDRAVIRCSRCVESSARRRASSVAAEVPRSSPCEDAGEDRAARHRAARRIATETTIATAKREIGDVLGFIEEKAEVIGKVIDLVTRARSIRRKLG